MSRSPHDDSDPYGINSQGHTVGTGRRREKHETTNMEAHSLMLELCHQLGAKDGESMVEMLFAAVKDAQRYRWLRSNWEAATGLTWRDPAPALDGWVDEQINPPSTRTADE